MAFSINPRATATFQDFTELDVSEGDLTLDSGTAPYGLASITLPLTDVTLVENLEPYSGQRVAVHTYNAALGTPRTNRVRNPQPQSAGSLWEWGDRWAWVRTHVAAGSGGPLGAFPYFRWTAPTTQVKNSRGWNVYGNPDITPGTGGDWKALPVRKGEPISLNYYIRTSSGSTFATSGRIHDGNGNWLNVVHQVIPDKVVATNTWTQNSGVYIPTADGYLSMYVLATSAGNFSAGATIDAGRFMIEYGAFTDLFYVDGDAGSGTGYAYRWLGTPGASHSLFYNPQAFRRADLFMTSREASHDGKTIRVEAATDEAILQAYADVTDDFGAFAHQESLRSVVNYVLAEAIPGAALEAGTANPNVRTYTAATNLLIDPGTAATAGGGYGGGNASIDLNDATWSISGDGDSFNIYSATSADSYLKVGSDTGSLFSGLTPGKTYVFSGTGNVKDPLSGSAMSGGEALRERALVVHTRVGGGSYNVHISPQVPNTVGAAARVSVEFTVPAGATEVFLRAYLGRGSGQVRWDGFRLSEKDTRYGADNTSYFDGDTPDTDEYVYNWTGVADTSTSTRTPLIDRAPEVLIWKAGETAWDFLQPLTAAAGLRLFCDENRRWRLVDPVDFTVPGRFTAQTSNSVSGSDTISITSGLYATGVLINWTWTDSAGNRQSHQEKAGTGPYVVSFDVERAYPGAGSAAARLAKFAGQGRTQEVTTGADFTVTPGQEVSISLPGTYTQLGTLQSVAWDLTNGTQQIGSIGLVETPPGAIDLAAGTIDAASGTIDAYTG